MISFIDFHFHFLANFQTLTSPHMLSIYMKPVCDSSSEPGSPVVSRACVVSIGFYRRASDSTTPFSKLRAK